MEIKETDFVQLLEDLGVQTYGLAFGWQLNDGDEFGLLRWIYTSLDHNNSLTGRENYRYKDLVKCNELLPEDELQPTIDKFMHDFPGLVVPGDKFGLQKAKAYNDSLRKRIKHLDKMDQSMQALIKQNKITEDKVSKEISYLSDNQIRSKVREELLGEKCLSLSCGIESQLNKLMDDISGHLTVYKNFYLEKEVSEQFLVSGPYKAYMQLRDQFKSYFYLYADKQFGKLDSQDSSELKDSEVIAAKMLEKRLYEAIWKYIHSVADLKGKQAKISLGRGLTASVHPGQVAKAKLEYSNDIELFKHDIQVIKSKLHNAVRDFCERQTTTAVNANARATLQLRQEILRDLSSLHAKVMKCSSIDILLYLGLNNEGKVLEDLVKFSEDVKEFLVDRRTGVSRRIKNMELALKEHSAGLKKMERDNFILNTYAELYGIRDADFKSLVRKDKTIDMKLSELKQGVWIGFGKKEKLLKQRRTSGDRLEASMCDGCTRRPNCWDSNLAALTVQVRNHEAALAQRIMDTVSKFISSKETCKNLRRNLWHWFLVNPGKFVKEIEEIKRKLNPRKPFAY